jgi:cytochrome P450
VKGGIPFFGQAFELMQGSAWDLITEWTKKYGTILRFHLFGSDLICVSDPEILKIILSSKLTSFKKDTLWTYKPFMVLLGNGLVTAEGPSWRSQRTLLSAHFRIRILEDIPEMALNAVKRLFVKLEHAKHTGEG